MPGPLDGIKVLELTQIIAGPMCGVMLSDLGADVVKIESPQGDGTRIIGQFAPHESKAFHVFNRGKRGMVVNLQTEEGRAVVYRLIRDFDVFLINARPGVAERLGVDYESLSSHNERLIYLESTAFGPEGPSAGRAGADIIAQAYSGLMVGDEKMDDEGNPTLITATTPADFGAAWTSAVAVCAALFHRERTGRGQLIETSLLGAALTLQNYATAKLPVSDAVFLQPTLDAVAEVRERGGTYREILEARTGMRATIGAAYLLYYGGYQTADGAIMLGCVTPPNRQQVRNALGLSEGRRSDRLRPIRSTRPRLPRAGRTDQEANRRSLPQRHHGQLDRQARHRRRASLAGQPARGSVRRSTGQRHRSHGRPGPSPNRTRTPRRPRIPNVRLTTRGNRNVPRLRRKHQRNPPRARLQRRQHRATKGFGRHRRVTFVPLSPPLAGGDVTE